MHQDVTNEAYRYVLFAHLKVAWLPTLQGGGLVQQGPVAAAVKERFGRVNRVFEMCCGPAFIGFGLLARGLCDSLFLADINPKAVAAVAETIRINGLADRVPRSRLRSMVA